MRTYQVIFVDHTQIKKDIEHKVITLDEINKKSKAFLDALLNTEFEVFESTETEYGLPTQLLIGGEKSFPIKKEVYQIASQMELGRYIGNGEFYMQITKNKFL